MRRGGEKGNAPEAQAARLFRDPRSARLIKNATTSARAAFRSPSASWPTAAHRPRRRAEEIRRLDGTELAISESQERMAVVAPADVQNSLRSRRVRIWRPPSLPR
ncbi:MAG: hypothetical protein ACLUFV_11845 [Acutalibacteraceae bacterium]